jgi:hypothetical protein
MRLAPARLRLPLPRVRYRRRAVGGRCADPWRRSAPVIDLAQSSDGKWSGSAILPGFGIKGAPLADLSVTDSAVNFSLAGVFGDPKFTGHITGEGAIAGDFTQSGNTAPFALRITGPPQMEPQRVSTPVRKELEGEWRSEFELFGSKLRAPLLLAGGTGVMNGTLEARDLKSGELLWDFRPQVSQQNRGWMLTAERKFNLPLLYASNWREAATSAVEREFSVGAIVSSPLIVNGVVYTGSTDGYLYALE